MSLVGSLDDLGLCDLLQILSLAGKSGLLRLETPDGEGWILFASGQVAGAGTKGGPPDLAALLRELGLDPTLAVEPVRLEALKRDAAEAAVVRMLCWRDGAFRFDAGGGEERVRASGLRLLVPIPSQYLALEGVRICDEGGPTLVGEAAASVLAPAAAPGPAARLPHPLVVIDPALGALEWLKGCLAESFLHVHIFQSTELGVTRIRQYLARGDQPAVLLARDARPDALSGIRDAAELVARLEQQAPRMPIILLVERDGAVGALRAAPARGVAAVVVRPRVDRLKDPRSRAEVTAAGEALRDALVAAVVASRHA
jgi:hypothetical protein